MIAVLTLAWGCSSDDTEEGRPLFAVGAKPAWKIDWTWHDAMPDWEDPPSTQFECSMNMLLELSQEFLPYSTDNDVMAVFINGECRGVGYRNVTRDGRVLFLLHVKGTSEETGAQMQLQYYCSNMKQLFTENDLPPFTPNNLMDEAFRIILSPIENGPKYPITTALTVMLPDIMPFSITDNDVMAVFVDDECRGFCTRNEILYPGWRGMIYSRQNNETAELRYYSAVNGGIYTFVSTFTLSGFMQMLEVTF